MWQAKFRIIMYATLSSFCLGMPTKTNTDSVNSGSNDYFQGLVFGSGSKPVLHKNKESDHTNPHGHEADEPASTAWDEMVMQLNPTVHCGIDAMTLNVQGTTMPNFTIDGDDGPVPVEQIPAHCGLSVTQGPTETFLTALYQGCYVTQQGNFHVLPLRLWGKPMKMACHMPPYALATVFCLASGMVAKIGGKSSDDLKLKVNGKWDLFIPASSECGFITESKTDGVEVTAPYQSYCWQMKGGEKFLSILYGDEELALSCLDPQNPHVSNVPYQSQKSNAWSYPSSDLIPGTSSLSSVIFSPTPSPASNSKRLGMMYTFPLISYSFCPMSNSKLMADPTSNDSTVTPGPQTTNTPTMSQTTSSMGRNPQPSAYPFSQIYYPIGFMLYHPKLMPYGYPWAFPLDVPTNATTTATKTTSFQTATTNSNILANNPSPDAYPFQHNYPFGPVHQHKPMPPGFPSKAVSSKTSPTATTSTIVDRNPRESANRMYYPFGLVPNHRKPNPYPYPWVVPAKAPTTTPVPATTTATSSTVIDGSYQRPVNSFSQLYHVNDPMRYNQKPVTYRYPWAFHAKAPTTERLETAPKMKPTTAPVYKTSTTSQTNATISSSAKLYYNQLYYPFGPMHCHQRPSRFLSAFPAQASNTAPNKPAPITPTLAVASKSSTPVVSRIARFSNPEQSAYSLNQIHRPFGSMLYYLKPVPYGSPLAFPAKIGNTAPRSETATTIATPTVIANYPQPSRFNPMRGRYTPAHHLGYPWALPANALTTTTSTIPKTSTTTTTSPHVYFPFVPIHFTRNLPNWMYYKPNRHQKGLKPVYKTSPPPIAIKHSK